MAELAALGVAANVAQFLVYGAQGAQFLYKAYRQTDDFQQARAELEVLAHSAQTSLASLKAASDADVALDLRLRTILSMALALAETLTQHIQDLHRCMAGKGQVARVKLAIKSWWTRYAAQIMLQVLAETELVDHHQDRHRTATRADSQIETRSESSLDRGDQVCVFLTKPLASIKLFRC